MPVAINQGGVCRKETSNKKKERKKEKKMIKAFAPFACKFVFGVALLMGILIGAGCSTFAPTNYVFSSLFWIHLLDD